MSTGHTASRPTGTEPTTLRVLVGCASCRRQFDASHRHAGERLRCLCGEVLTVPRETRGAAQIVRCSACGAPRAPGVESCSYCSAPFAAAERDRYTVCPGCTRRISDRAGFCPGCGIRIDPRNRAGEATSHTCPACEQRTQLVSRPFPEPAGNLLECPRCAGLWLGRGLFAALERRARATVGDLPPATRATPVRRQPVVYRPCPDCSRRMLRRNYGGSSGVIVDLCADHGLWFDDEELGRVLDWIRAGGLDRAEQRAEEERRRRERERRRRRAELAEPPIGGADDAVSDDLTELGALLGRLFRIGGRFLRGSGA